MFFEKRLQPLKRNDVHLALRLMSRNIRKKAKARGVTALIDAGSIRPVMDRVFPFEAVNEAYIETDQGQRQGRCANQQVASRILHSNKVRRSFKEPPP